MSIYKDSDYGDHDFHGDHEEHSIMIKTDRIPDIAGDKAIAWHGSVIKKNRDLEANLTSIIVQSDQLMPTSSAWLVSSCHLRDIPGVKPARKRYDRAEYEIFIASLCPHHVIDLDKLEDVHIIRPIEFTEQFHVPFDEDAIKIAEKVASTICDGDILPSQEYAGQWQRLVKLLAHNIRSGIEI